MSIEQKCSFKTWFIILFSSFLCSCVSLRSSIKDDGKQIPPKFGSENGTLLVVKKGKRSFDRYLEKNFAANYTGNYLFVFEKDINSNLYSDKNKYRYVFKENKAFNYTTVRRTAADHVPNITASFMIIDRVSGNRYSTNRSSGQFSKLMRAYIQALEEARILNKQ